MKKILDQIIKYDNIAIYHHVRPDGDAIFSSLALFEFIKSNFKKKNVVLCGKDKFDLVDIKYKKVSDKFIANSLSIIIDTANAQRVDDERFIKSKYIIKIDHHPNFDSYGNINYVKEDAVATCEVLYELLTSKEFKKYKINDTCGNYLFKGILTDSLHFKTNNTTSKTLLVASKLVKEHKIDIAKTNFELFSNNIENYDKITKFRSYLKIDNHLGYGLFNKKDLLKLRMSTQECKNSIEEFGNIKGINIWCVFAYNSENKAFEGSLRASRGYVINDIAAKFNGGGHKYACGVKNLSIDKVKELINELSKIANK